MQNRQEEFKTFLSQVLVPLQAEITNLPTKVLIEETSKKSLSKNLREERSKVESLEKLEYKIDEMGFNGCFEVLIRGHF